MSGRYSMVSSKALSPLLVAATFATALSQISAARADTETERIKTRIESEVRSLEEFLRAGRDESGITPDRRDTPYQTEVMRLNVAPQLLGYLELHKASGNATHLQEAVARGDYLIRNLKSVLRRRLYDGMIAYAFLQLHEQTQELRFLKAGQDVNRYLMDYDDREIRLNTGLMTVMGFAQQYRLKPDAKLLKRIRELLVLLKSDQNPDGSFAHAHGGVDTHYSAWMAMQLVLIQRSLGPGVLKQEIDAVQEPLAKFLSERVRTTEAGGFAAGEPRYEETVCKAPDQPRTCRKVYFYGTKTANRPEYDSRGWSNELAYHVLVQAHPALANNAAKTESILDFMGSVKNQVAYPDKWRYPVDAIANPDQGPFGNQSRSVLRTSVVFWTLAVTLNEAF